MCAVDFAWSATGPEAMVVAPAAFDLMAGLTADIGAETMTLRFFVVGGLALSSSSALRFFEVRVACAARWFFSSASNAAADVPMASMSPKKSARASEDIV